MIRLSLIVACSRPKIVLKFLESVQSQSNLDKIEVIVAGKISSLPSSGIWSYSCKYLNISKEHPNVKRNAAFKISAGKHIAFIDDDVCLSMDWISHALDLIHKNPDYVFTGPEKPTGKSQVSRQIYESQKLWICEFSSSHVNFKNEKVHWFDVPFCNCIIPRKYLKLLNENIPWDMDDFHFFNNLGSQTSYFNSKNLLVFHNRYKDSLKEHLKYKWNLRARTGEKLVTHFSLYRKIPGVVLILISPVVFFIFFLIHPPIMFIVSFLYVFFVFQQVLRSADLVNLWDRSKIVFLIHLVIFISFFTGFFKALFRKLHCLFLDQPK